MYAAYSLDTQLPPVKHQVYVKHTLEILVSSVYEVYALDARVLVKCIRDIHLSQVYKSHTLANISFSVVL